MTQQQLKVGDRVKINDRTVTNVGKKGVITYISGGQYWVRLDDGNQVVPALHRWWLDPE